LSAGQLSEVIAGLAGKPAFSTPIWKDGKVGNDPALTSASNTHYSSNKRKADSNPSDVGCRMRTGSADDQR